MPSQHVPIPEDPEPSSSPPTPPVRKPERPPPPDRTPYRPPYHKPPKPIPISCPDGFKYSEGHRTCIDINECYDEDTCDSNQDCINTHGSYHCNCKRGFTKDITGACVDVNECQVGTHDCSEGQRCDNTIGSFYCPRTAGCGTGYTLNHANNICEDDDECALGTHNCKDLGSQFQCKNTQGSYRCERIPRLYYTTSTTFTFPTFRPYPNNVLISQKKKCLPGYTMNIKGDCEDIDECKNNPCSQLERCENLNGRYQCISRLQCKLGFELNSAGTECVDIDECARGTHQCSSTQICKNGFGYHVCTCPPGHKLNANNHCEDINECEYYRGRACSNNAECINTIGSFECRCNDGLKQVGRDICDDIDECEMSGLCQQRCVNLWGSYRCSCDRGYSLNSDNRTCSDIDECEKFKDQQLCIATCQNTPGSYVCSCPRGYRLGSDGRTCQDIDECLDNVCGRPDATCLNTRGNYKCFTIQCPPNYIRDPEHKSRCKRAKHTCDHRDISCIEMPHQYSYHFMTFISKLPILQGHIDFFQMRGPVWPGSAAEFTMRIVNVNCPESIERAHEGFFRMNTLKHKAILALIRSIEGPQEIELQLELKLYYNHIFNSKMVAKIFLIVSEYPF
ncbi:EGF-like domain containing protein [Oryctes borbonicus]|uniref:EGF-like domain containing protein n=1 Tax=Oryctes borbonicus TaxID=1629725 RepID=A0A0T6B2J0_9SCAR|nr:EGF-like domain containing protein [Oryctes borbonicus]